MGGLLFFLAKRAQMIGSLVRREITWGSFVVYEYEQALLYRAGRFVRLLPAGQHRVWGWRKEHARIIDLRPTKLSVTAQKLLTSDPFPITVNFSVDYRIAEPLTALHGHQNGLEKLYESVQQQGRTLVGEIPLKELLGPRAELAQKLSRSLETVGESLGLAVLGADVRDLILVPQLRELVSKEAEQKWRAQAALASAREEVATLRALANAARLVRENPEILKLRELELAADFARQGGNSIVFQTGSSSIAASGKTEPEESA